MTKASVIISKTCKINLLTVSPAENWKSFPWLCNNVDNTDWYAGKQVKLIDNLWLVAGGTLNFFVNRTS